MKLQGGSSDGIRQIRKNQKGWHFFWWGPKG